MWNLFIPMFNQFINFSSVPCLFITNKFSIFLFLWSPIDLKNIHVSHCLINIVSMLKNDRNKRLFVFAFFNRFLLCPNFLLRYSFTSFLALIISRFYTSIHNNIILKIRVKYLHILRILLVKKKRIEFIWIFFDVFVNESDVFHVRDGGVFVNEEEFKAHVDEVLLVLIISFQYSLFDVVLACFICDTIRLWNTNINFAFGIKSSPRTCYLKCSFSGIINCHPWPNYFMKVLPIFLSDFTFKLSWSKWTFSI